MEKELLDTYYKSHEAAVQFIQNMLFYNRARLAEIPFHTRKLDVGIYTIALRISRGISCERFVEDLAVLADDIEQLDNSSREKHMLLSQLDSSLSINNYKKNEVFINFERNISPKVLCELLRSRGATEEIIRAELRKKGFIE